MTTISKGCTVRIHYTGTLADGTVFDSSKGRDPLEFTAGVGHIIVGLDAALAGMAVGEKKVVTIASDEAYGPRRDGGRQEIKREMIPDTVPLEVGGQLQMQTKDGRVLAMQVMSFDDAMVVVDANHPLAGKDLTFDFEVVSIEPETDA